jgi:predicted Zn finger-like uncharacterized protein
MLIICPHCAANYRVSPAAIGGAGRQVRCLRCRNVWMQVPSADAPALGSSDISSMEQEDDQVVAAFRAELAGDAADGAESPDEDRPSPGSQSQESPPDETMEADADDAAEPPADAALPQLSAADNAPLAPDLPSSAVATPGADVESTVRRRLQTGARKRRKWPSGPLPVVIVLLGAVLAALIVWRGAVVRQAPQMASLYRAIGLPVNLRGLAFKEIQTAKDIHDGVPILVVEGAIANVASVPIEVPRLRLAMQNDTGVEVYSWSAMPTQAVLAPGESMPFRSRLASPPSEGRSVVVRFFNSRDTVAGLR